MDTTVDDTTSPASRDDAPPPEAPSAAPTPTVSGTSPTTGPTEPETAAPPPPVASDAPPVRKSGLVLTPEQQEAVNALTGQARTEGRDAAYRYAFRELGVKDLAEARALIATARGQQTEAQTRAEALARELADLRTLHEGKVTELGQTLETSKTEALAWRARAEAALRVAEVKVAAKERGFIRPDDAIKFLDVAQFAVDLERQSVEGVAAALDALAQERPYLLRSAADAPTTTAAPPPPLAPATPAPADPAQAITEAELEAARSGMRRSAREFF